MKTALAAKVFLNDDMFPTVINYWRPSGVGAASMGEKH